MAHIADAARRDALGLADLERQGKVMPGEHFEGGRPAFDREPTRAA